MKDIKVGTMIYRTDGGWRVFARVYGPTLSSKGRLMPHRISDPDHEKSVIEVKRLRDEWSIEARRRAGQPALTATTPGSIGADVDDYLALPQVMTLDAFKRGGKRGEYGGERGMQVRTMVNGIGAARPRLSIQKKEWERLLGRLQRDRNWEPGTFNKWLHTLWDFYTELEDPVGTDPNPVRKIKEQDVPEALARAIDYKVIVKVLARLEPAARTAKNKVSFENDQWARHQHQKGDSKAAIAAALGVTIQAVAKLLARAPLVGAREIERIYLMLRAMAFTGLRPKTLVALTSSDFHPETNSVWVASRKRDRSREMPLDAWGVTALQAIEDANAWGEFNRSNARRYWRAACRAEGMKDPLPRPYDLRHSFLTKALEECESPEALILLSGHTTVRTVMRYTKGAQNKVARSVAEGVGRGISAILGPPPKRQLKRSSTVVTFPNAKRA